MLLIGSLFGLIAAPAHPDAELVAKLKSKRSPTGIGILIDYDYPIQTKRLWVIALKNLKRNGKRYKAGEVIMNTRVSHAALSGLIFAKRFSNKPNTQLSSRGFFRTASNTHRSPGFGYPALRIHGLDKALNDNVRKRAIIFHKSKSWFSAGCFMTPAAVNKKLTNLIKGGSIVYVHVSNPNDLIDPPLPSYSNWRLNWYQFPSSLKSLLVSAG